MSFWAKFEQLCTERNLKPQSVEIMEVAGVTSPAITAWKKGSKPKYDVMVKLADYFNVDVRYLLDMTDSREGKDIIKQASEELRNCGVEIDSFDNDKGVGQEYVCTYKGKSYNYQEHEFKALCHEVITIVNDAELFSVDRFCREHFGGEVFTSNAELTQQEWKLILNYRSLNDDGKIIIQAAMIKELRKMEE